MLQLFYSVAPCPQTVVFVELDPNPMTLQQAEDRAHRVGQRSCVHVYYLIGRGEAGGGGGACSLGGPRCVANGPGHACPHSFIIVMYPLCSSASRP